MELSQALAARAPCVSIFIVRACGRAGVLVRVGLSGVGRTTTRKKKKKISTSVLHCFFDSFSFTFPSGLCGSEQSEQRTRPSHSLNCKLNAEPLMKASARDAGILEPGYLWRLTSCPPSCPE